MPNNYTFFDTYASIQTAESSLISGSVHRPIFNLASVLGPIPITIGSASVSGTTGASIIGQLPAGTAVLGSVATLQGTNPWQTVGSVMLHAGTNMFGSVVSYPGAVWPISSVYGNISGSVISYPGTGAGSVQAVQSGTNITSIVGSIPSSTLVGNYAHRNDAVASFLGGNLSWNPMGSDSAGRPLIKPFAAEEARIEGYSSTVNTSQTTLIAAAGAGLRNYVTDLWFFNTGAAATLITLKDGAGSILGYTGAPAGSGSNLPGLQTPIRTGANETFDFQAATGTSVLYATVKGFRAP